MAKSKSIRDIRSQLDRMLKSSLTQEGYQNYKRLGTVFARDLKVSGGYDRQNRVLENVRKAIKTADKYTTNITVKAGKYQFSRGMVADEYTQQPRSLYTQKTDEFYKQQSDRAEGVGRRAKNSKAKKEYDAKVADYNGKMASRKQELAAMEKTHKKYSIIPMEKDAGDWVLTNHGNPIVILAKNDKEALEQYKKHPMYREWYQTDDRDIVADLQYGRYGRRNVREGFSGRALKEGELQNDKNYYQDIEKPVLAAKDSVWGGSAKSNIGG